MIPGDLARKLGIIPIRCMGQQLIIAVPDNNTDHIAAELRKVTDKSLRFVGASVAQIQCAISVYYTLEHRAA